METVAIIIIVLVLSGQIYTTVLLHQIRNIQRKEKTEEKE